MSGGDERRNHPRVLINKPFRVRFDDTDGLRRVYVKDISHGGMFLRTPNPRPRGSLVSVTLELPDGTLLPVAGRVVHVHPSGNGIEFHELSRAVPWLLEEYIRLHEDADMNTPDGAEVIELETSDLGIELEDEVEPARDAPPPPPIPRPSLALRLLELEERVIRLEERVGGSPYHVLGLEVWASTQDVENARGRCLDAITTDEIDVPPYLATRIGRVALAAEEAAGRLGDAKERAAIDVDLGLLVSGGAAPESRAAFRAELSVRRAQASHQEKRAFSKAAPHAAEGSKAYETGDLEAAAIHLRTALLYDPWDHHVRQRLAVVQAERSVRLP